MHTSTLVPLLLVSAYTLLGFVFKVFMYQKLDFPFFVFGELLCLLNLLLYTFILAKCLQSPSSAAGLLLPVKILFVLFLFYFIHQTFGAEAILSFLAGYFLFLPLILLRACEHREKNS